MSRFLQCRSCDDIVMRFAQLIPRLSPFFNNYSIGYSIVSDAESQPTPSQPTPSSSSQLATGKPSNKSLTILAVLFAISGISVFVVPRVLQDIYYQEEEAKRDKNAVIVGTRTDMKPPPGLSNPFAGMPSPPGGNATESGNESDKEKESNSSPN